MARGLTTPDIRAIASRTPSSQSALLNGVFWHLSLRHLDGCQDVSLLRELPIHAQGLWRELHYLERESHRPVAPLTFFQATLLPSLADLMMQTIQRYESRRLGTTSEAAGDRLVLIGGDIPSSSG